MSKKLSTNKSVPKTAPVTSRAAVNETVFQSTPKGKSFWIACLIFLGLSFALYGYSLFSDYVLDDQIVITDNQFTKRGFSGIKDILKKETFVGYFGEQRDLVAGSRYRPLSLVSFAIEWSIFAPNEASLEKLRTGVKRDYNTPAFATVRFVHHFFNIIFYFLSTMMLYRVLLLLFPSKEEEKWYFSLPFVASLLFLLHPIHTEAVANIKGRDEILSFLGSFTTLYFVLNFVDKKRISYLFLGVFSFLLAVLAKENALTFLAVIPLTLYCFREKTIAKSLLSIVPFFIATLLYLMVRYSVIGYLMSSGKEITDVLNNPFYGVSLSDRFATVFYTLGRYIQLMVFPHPLTHDYYPYQIPIMHWSNWEALVSLVAYVGLTAYGIWSVYTKRSVIGYGILFYLVTLFIVSNIPFSVGTFMNDRFIYLSSVGFCIILAYLFTQKVPKTIGIAVVTLLCLGYGLKTITRVPDWKDTMSLNTSAIKVSPNSARANLFYGIALYNKAQGLTQKASAEQRVITPEESEERKKLLYDALPYIEKSVEIVPSYGSAIHMLSGVDAEIYQFDKDLDKLLKKFASYLRYRERLSIEDPVTKSTFIDKYLVYLDAPQNMEKLVPFYTQVSQMFLDEKKDYENAIRYASNGLRLMPGNLELSQIMSKAQQMKLSSPVKR